MLLNLINHLRPDITMATSGLSKVNNGGNQAALLEMLHIIKYMLDIRNFWLKLESLGNKKATCDIVCQKALHFSSN